MRLEVIWPPTYIDTTAAVTLTLSIEMLQTSRARIINMTLTPLHLLDSYLIKIASKEQKFEYSIKNISSHNSHVPTASL